MQDRKIIFNKVGYDPFIDFTKGMCILFVVLTHCMPEPLRQATLFPVWGLPAVPLFLMIQTFHSYKRDVPPSLPDFSKLWKRIIWPFIFTELIIFSILAVHMWHQGVLGNNGFIVGFILGGGTGPGSYYPWIYLQFAILLPLLHPLFKRLSGKQLTILFIVIGIVTDPLCYYLQVPEWMYKLLFVRYFFLIYLGYLLAKEKLILNTVTLVLSLMSVFFLIIIYYTDYRLTLSSYNKSWHYCHWFCYVYMAYLMLYLIRVLYEKLTHWDSFVDVVNKMGKYSYEIFLFQMVYFMLIANTVRKVLAFIGNETIETTLYVVLSVLLCVSPVLMYKRFRKREAPVRNP